MNHDRLWAPWRLAYVSQQADSPKTPARELKLLPGADQACFICRAVADSADRENLVVHRGRQTITLINRYPYNNGHLLIAPQRHKGDLAELADEEQLEIAQVITRWTVQLRTTMNAEGFNVGLNLGAAAGAGLPGHLHWHIVPRWDGDTNFMPTIAGAKVIPQALEALWEMFAEAGAGK